MHRTAVVTGVSKGLGREVFAALAEAGWGVIGVSRSPLDDFPQQGVHVRGDVSDPATVDAVRRELAGRPVDLLVNNAVSGSKQHRLADVDADEVTRALAVNVVAPLRLTQALLPSLLAAQRPLVLNLSSRLGSLTMQARGDFRAFGTSYAYRVSRRRDGADRVPRWADPRLPRLAASRVRLRRRERQPRGCTMNGLLTWTVPPDGES